MSHVGLLGLGIVTPLGDNPATVLRRVQAGDTALAPQAHLHALPDARAAVVPGPELGPWLARKKDIRILPRAAKLALPAAGRALATFEGDREELAVFVAVGREPPDEGECEAALAAMERDGQLDLDRLGDEGRALYPPLLPLRTLPNMVLAHVSIQHGIRGENGVYAGGAEAGRQALAEGLRTVVEGRARFALVGAAWSGVDLASARDRWRMGEVEPPGEAAVFALLGWGGHPLGELPPGDSWKTNLGSLGPVEGVIGLIACR